MESEKGFQDAMAEKAHLENRLETLKEMVSLSKTREGKMSEEEKKHYEQAVAEISQIQERLNEAQETASRLTPAA